MTFSFVLDQVLKLLDTNWFLLLVVVAGAWDILDFVLRDDPGAALFVLEVGRGRLLLSDCFLGVVVGWAQRFYLRFINELAVLHQFAHFPCV